MFNHLIPSLRPPKSLLGDRDRSSLVNQFGRVSFRKPAIEALEDRRLLSATPSPLGQAVEHADTTSSVYAEMDFGIALHRATQLDTESLIEDLIKLDRSDRFQLNLFPGEAYSAVVHSRVVDVNGTLSITAQLEHYEYAFTYLIITGQQLFLSVDIPEEGEKYITRLNPLSGETYLLQLDLDQLDELLPSEPVIVGLHEESAEPVDAPWDSFYGPISTGGEINGGEIQVEYVWQDSMIEEGMPMGVKDWQEEDGRISDGKMGSFSDDRGTKAGQDPIRLSGSGGAAGTTQIDVMVVYTPAARNWADNAEGSINNTIAAAMARSNTASNNSNLGISFNLVYSGEVDYTESGSSTDLGRLRGKNDGFLDEVHTIRDNVAADMVAILTFTQDTGGVAYLLTSRYGREDWAFSLTRVQQASWSYTFVHELAHNMGASHHKQQNVQAGPTNWSDWPENVWSAGWRWQGNNGQLYTSVMSYSSGQYYADGLNATRVPYFSNPSISFQGQPTGHPVDGDNARTLREIRQFVGQYRDADTLLYCTAQGGATNYGISRVQIGSIDQASGTGPYYDFSFLHADVRAGVPEQLTVNITNPFWNNQLLVWVDWNNDKDFLDSDELVFASSQGAVAQYNVLITPPADVQPGPKRMRMRLHMPSFGGNSTPCGNNDFGEVQDFKLNVLPPEAEVAGSFVYHTDWNGSFENSIDTGRVLAKEEPETKTLSLDHLLNNTSGVTGLGFEINQPMGIIGSEDLIFQWSPQGAFNESLHPPVNWTPAAEPSLIAFEPGQGNRLRIEWAPGVIMNRWLRVSIMANSNTGLAEPAVYYIGHLLGETTGPAGGLYTVSFADIAEIREVVGQSVDASSPFDIDKSGIVSFADIAAMRPNIGAQLTNITISSSQSDQNNGGGPDGNTGDGDEEGNGGGSGQGNPWILANSQVESFRDDRREGLDFAQIAHSEINFGAPRQATKLATDAMENRKVAHDAFVNKLIPASNKNKDIPSRESTARELIDLQLIDLQFALWE